MKFDGRSNTKSNLLIKVFMTIQRNCNVQFKKKKKVDTLLILNLLDINNGQNIIYFIFTSIILI